MEKSNDCAFEFWATTSVDGCWRKSLPDDRFTDVGSNEERDTRSKSISFLEKLVKQDNDEPSNNKLDDQKDANSGTKIGGLAVEASQNVDTGLTEGEDDGEKFLGCLVLFTVRLQIQIDVNQMRSGE